jgi:hypothetical protein
VVAKYPAALTSLGVTALQWPTGQSLNNTGEAVKFLDAFNTLVDSVSYLPTAPWPLAANGQGSSLILCDYNSDNSMATSWMACTTPTSLSLYNKTVNCNPGVVDHTSCLSSVTEVAKPTFQVYPNPNTGRFVISTSQSGNYDVQVIDLLGKTVASFQLNGTEQEAQINQPASGIYFVRLADQRSGQVSTVKIVVE